MASLQPDPYKILGVSKDAQLPEIRSAHRKLVLKCHPDKVQDPTLKAAKQDEFQKVQQAYELLSDENERAKYDDSVKLAELRSQMAAKGMSANTSAPRSAPRTYEVNIRTAEPRPDTFKTTSYRTAYAAPKMYTQPTSRSYEEDLHKSSPIFEETRSARRTASYEKPTYEKPSRQEEDRDRERRRRKEDERERERIAEMRRQEIKAQEKRERRAAEKAAEEKEARRRERKAQEKAEKERDKERRSATEDKARRHKAAYVEPYGEEETYIPKSDKKKSSSSKKYEEKEKDRPAVAAAAAAAPTVDTVNKMTANMHLAASYMDKSRRAQPPLSRAQTFNEGSIRYATVPAVPTPPAITPFAPPPVPGAEDDGRRTKSRRSSETKRDKSSHKKSSPLKEPPLPQSPEVFTASPSSRHVPQFTTSPAGGSPPKHGISKAQTFHEYSRPPPGPTRAQTFTYGLETDSRGRTRSRLQPQVLSEDSESDEEPRSRRSHRHKTHDLEPIPLDYGRATATRYTVNTGGRAVPVTEYYREDSPPPRKAYYADVRPPMPPRESSYSSSAFKVKTANRYTTDDVQYSNIPHRYTQEYAY